MNEEQAQAAKLNIIQWLSDPSELGRKPRQISLVNAFIYNDMTYYIFKFKANLRDHWRLAFSGGFEGDQLQPCGHTYSTFSVFHEETAQEECITMIDAIMKYWQEQAKAYEEQNNISKE